ncbi:MAG: ATP-binding protein [Janthinobacterium lividum]
MKRAISNVIENACTYATHVTAKPNFTRSGPVLSVRDDGPGIPEPLLETVFSPFHRVDPSRNRQTGGVGLGPTSARTIVRAHGGEITLRNRPDGGLLVMMTLSVAMDMPEPTSLALASGLNRAN